MSGWLIAVPAEENAGRVTIETLYAVRQVEAGEALRTVADVLPSGVRVSPHIVSQVSDSVLWGLRLHPGDVARLERTPTGR